MNQVAILVPTYSGHKKYFKLFLDSFHKNSVFLTADLWCVLTENDEFEEYADVRKIILPEKYADNSDRGIINKKKLYGLNAIKEFYEYIIILDDDTGFNKTEDMLMICENYFEAKILIGNKAKDKNIVPYVMKECLEFFCDTCKSKFLEKAGGLYLWFNQPSIYKTSTLADFFELIDLKNQFESLNWFQFDYYIYMIYLLCHENFRVVDCECSSTFGVCEALSEKECRINSSAILKKYALQATCFITELCELDPVFIIHIDRHYVEVPWFQRIGRKIRRIIIRCLTYCQKLYRELGERNKKYRI